MRLPGFFPTALPLALLAILLACTEPGEERSVAAPDIEAIVSLPSLSGTAPARPEWSPDSRTVAFLWNDHGMPFRDIWLVSIDDGEPRQLTRLGPAPEEIEPLATAGSLESLQARVRERARGGIREQLWSPEGDAVYFVYDGQIHRVSVPRGEIRTVSDQAGGKSRLAFSPDGRWLSFLSGGDLWLMDREEGGLRQATDLGEPGPGTVNIGAFVRPDVYIAGYEWSPDSRRIALEKVDQRDVRKVPFPSYLHEEPLLHEVRRPYPGDTELRREIGLLTVDDGRLQLLDTPAPTRRLNLEYQWSPTGDELLLMQGADVAEDRWILVVDADGGDWRQVWHDHRPHRVYPVFRARWHSDGGGVYFIGDHEGHYSLYSLPLDAEAVSPKRLSGDYDVAGERGATWMQVSEAGELFFVSSRHSPYERHVYRMAEAGDDAERLTRLPGLHAPSLSPDGEQLALVSSNDLTPPELYLLSLRDDGEERRITRSPLPSFYDYNWIKPRYVSFPARDGDYEIHARIIEPPNMDPDKQYPVIFGNIYSNTVRNAWNADRPTSALQQQMALAGEYINVQVDVRGSIGYGVDFREAFQGDWGRGDLEDLHAAVDYLATLPYVDTDRIGIWGNSYGGLMVLSALFRKPGLFAAGVAGAPAVDVWHFTGFDQHLTRRPDTHPAIFEEGSLMDLGEDLADPLLIIHGLHDDIVPLKTTLMLSEKLMLLGKDAELLVVHDSGHWWAGQEHYAIHTFRRLVDFFHRHVPPGGRDKH